MLVYKAVFRLEIPIFLSTLGIKLDSGSACCILVKICPNRIVLLIGNAICDMSPAKAGTFGYTLHECQCIVAIN